MHAWRKRGGGATFDRSEGYADLPSLQLPCGQCRGCRLARSRDWAVRCVHEASMHRENCFLTLTYSDEHLPEGGTLRVEDFQKFMKRLRKHRGPKAKPVRYYHCGEYGEETARPHYHACLFGAAFSGDRIQLRVERGNRYFTSPLVSRLWPFGQHVIGELTWQSAAYVARYVMKKRTGDQAAEEYTRVDERTGECWAVAPPYATMSRRPGIGAGWLEKYGDTDVFPEDEVIHAGKRFRPPRFYDERRDPKELEAVKAKRRKAVLARKEELTPERLKVREQCAEARLGHLKRNL